MAEDKKVTAKPIQKLVVHAVTDRANTSLIEIMVMGETARYALSHDALRQLSKTLVAEVAKLDVGKPN